MKLRKIIELAKWLIRRRLMTKYIFLCYKYEITCQQIRGAILDLRFQIYLIGRKK